MPGMPPPVADERQALLAFLAQQRSVVRIAAYGLSDEEARTTPAASTLSVGGLIKHVARVEKHWIDIVLERQEPFDPSADWESGFRLEPHETLGGVFAEYDAVAAETERVVSGIDDLGRPVPVPRGVPWFPADVAAWSVRWVLLHIIEETARHAGHADIVRESLDGATAFPLMAAAEGWPASPWIEPWQPAGAGSGAVR